MGLEKDQPYCDSESGPAQNQPAKSHRTQRSYSEHENNMLMGWDLKFASRGFRNSVSGTGADSFTGGGPSLSKGIEARPREACLLG